jgi:hypothetical protein
MNGRSHRLNFDPCGEPTTVATGAISGIAAAVEGRQRKIAAC